MVNLLDNAVKYSSDDSVVLVEGGILNNCPFIRVNDQGCGILPDELPRIFERFYRVNSPLTSSRPGTGLGLAIVKHITQAHGGRIEVESEPEKGSIFTIWLPESCRIMI